MTDRYLRSRDETSRRRARRLLGTIRLTKVEPNQEELQRSLAFNPIFLTSGIELSENPLVSLRSAVYALSVTHRH